MPRRAGGWTHHDLEVPDYDTIRKNAQQAVKDQLGALARPDDRIEQAAEIIRQADAEIAIHIGDRNAAAASLWFYEGVRGLSKILGVYPTAYRQILYEALYGIDPRSRKSTDDVPAALPSKLSDQGRVELAEEAGLARLEDAAESLPVLSRIVAEAQARRAAALPFMQDAALALSEEPYGWDGPRIGQHAGVSRKLVSDHWRIARKRRGY